MPRGGARKNTGPSSSWNAGKTRTIRVPIALADQILAFARTLDVSATKPVIPNSSEPDTDSEDEEEDLDDDDGSDPTDAEVIKAQAEKNYKLITEVRMLERELKEARAQLASIADIKH